MKKLCFTLALTVLFQCAKAQCSVDTIPQADAGSGICYINDVIFNSTTLSSNSSYTAAPSYQDFTNTYVSVEQGASVNVMVSGANGSNYNLFAWVDWNQDGFYSSTEILFYDQFVSSTAWMGTFYVDVNTTADTFPMRITKVQGFPGWGPGANDACEAPGWSETEDYSLVITCFPYSTLFFDNAPSLCFGDSVFLSASVSYGDIAWYAGDTMQPFGTGSALFLQTNPGCTDTVVYLRNTTNGCASLPLDSMMITFLPSPVAQILSPDTVMSCSVTTIAALSGPYDFSWNTGDLNDTTVISNGFGGMLQVSVMDPVNGCYSTDHIWVNIAPLPPASYSGVLAGSGFCSNLEIYLNYDSLTSPGTCTWYSYPSMNALGTGSQVLYTLPDTGTFQFMAVVNSFCGADTLLHTFEAVLDAPYDSLYLPGQIPDSVGFYEVCYTSTGVIDVLISGLQGDVDHWVITDLNTNFSMNWAGDTLIHLPAGMMQQGHVYTVQAYLTGPQGCGDVSSVMTVRPANTINFNLADSVFVCQLPATIGQSNVNYGIYDILWSTGDTTTPIVLANEGMYTLYTIDHISGCVMNDTFFFGRDRSNPLQDTIYSCNGTVHLDMNMAAFTVNQWDVYDQGWSLLGTELSNEIYLYDGSGNLNLVLNGTSVNGCWTLDTAFIDFGGAFSFSLGPDINSTSSPVTLSAPSGYPIYQWSPVNATTSSVSVTSSGTYICTIDNGNGCTYSDTIVVNILPTSIEEMSAAIQVYPNPAADQVYITSSSQIQQICLKNLNGQIVKMETQLSAGNASLNVADLPDGIYIAEILTGQGASNVKIVVSRNR